MTEQQSKELRDLHEGGFDFKTAAEMVGIAPEARTEARQQWREWTAAWE